MRVKTAIAAALCCVCFLAPAGAAPSAQNSGVAKNALPATAPADEGTNAGSERERKIDQFNADYLDTQRRMADAGEKQITVSAWLILMAVIEIAVVAAALYFLIKTFREARRTADAAKQSADASRTAADAAQRSADIADRTYAASNSANTEILSRMEAQLAAVRQSAHAAGESAKAAAAQARASEQAYKNIERPQLHMEVVAHNFKTVQHASTPRGTTASGQMTVRFKFLNYGRQPAIIKEIRCSIDCWNEAPEKPAAQIFLGTVPRVIAPNGDLNLPDCTMPRPLTAGEVESIFKGNSALFFHGIVKYSDIFNGDFETEFMWAYAMHIDYFGPIQNAPHNRYT